MNLCDICKKSYAECINEYSEMPEIEYGNDESNTGDAVLKCSWFEDKCE